MRTIWSEAPDPEPGVTNTFARLRELIFTGLGVFFKDNTLSPAEETISSGKTAPQKTTGAFLVFGVIASPDGNGSK